MNDLRISLILAAMKSPHLRVKNSGIDYGESEFSSVEDAVSDEIAKAAILLADSVLKRLGDLK